jgi:hypothetical protein
MALPVGPRYLVTDVPKRRLKLTPSEIAVRSALRRRGLVWEGERDPTPLFVPGGRSRDRHYTLLGHYSYRLFLRDVLKHRNDLRLSFLTRYAGPRVAAEYLRFLTRTRLVKATARGRYRLGIQGVTSFGQTLEWYIAELLTREFGCAATFGIRIPHARHGGDYDVVACAEGELIYLETKSAPPRQIVEGEVRAFVDRVDTLRPQLALFLVDTQLRMRDKLVPFFRAEIRRRRLKWLARRLEREIWRVGPEIYLLNSSPDLTRNLRACLATHFQARGITVD